MDWVVCLRVEGEEVREEEWPSLARKCERTKQHKICQSIQGIDQQKARQGALLGGVQCACFACAGVGVEPKDDGKRTRFMRSSA